MVRGVAVVNRANTERVVRLPTTHFLCWYCSGQLPPQWTTVDGGPDRRVHYGCRAAAAALVASTAPILVEPQPDYGDLELTRPIG